MRIKIISCWLVILSSICIVRLFYIQVLHGDEYQRAAERQYARPVSEIFSRGTIYLVEKNGARVGAATLADSFYLVVDPSKIADSTQALTELQVILPIDTTTFMQKVRKAHAQYEVVATNLSQETADRLTKLHKKYITVYTEKQRSYPGGTLASHVIGFVGKDKENGDLRTGQSGIELYFNDILARDAGSLYRNFFAEIFSNLTAVFSDTQHQQLDGDIVLTIEPVVQHELEQTLTQARDTWKSDLAGGIIMDPMSGKIIAMAGSPDFLPQEYNKVQDQAVFRNPLVQDVYEMGSTMKPLVMAAALDMGSVTAETTYTDTQGFVMVSGKKISNYDGKGRGTVNMQEVLNQSLNTGMVFVEKKMGKERFVSYLRGYGFGQATGIELPGEVPGIVTNLESSHEVDYATAAFGQGIAVTPIQMVKALSIIANGGRSIQPSIVDSVDYRIGVIDQTNHTAGKQLITPQASQEITRMLVTVVDKALLHGKVKMEHYQIAAKTGTAQLVNAAGKEYYTDRYLHSFFAYFPAYHPQFLIFLFHTNPKGAEYASATLTEPSMSLTKFLINYYNVPPDR